MKPTIQAFLAVIVCAVAAIAMWWRGLSVDPVIHVPAAYATWPPDGFHDYEQAASDIKDAASLDDAIQVDGWIGEHLISWSLRRHLVNENADVLARVAAIRPINEIPRVVRPKLYPGSWQYARLAELLDLKAMVERRDHNQRGALRTNLKELQMGAEIPLSGDLDYLVIGAYCENLCRADVYISIPSLNATQTGLIVRRMEANVGLERREWALDLEADKWGTEESLQDDMSSSDWIPSLFRGWPQEVGLSALANGSRKVMRDVAGIYDAAAAYSTMPYRKARSILLASETDPCASMTARSIPGALLRYDENCAQDSLLTISLALHAYRLEHPRYPATLNSLVPRYLFSVPADPFSRAPLKYRRYGSSYVLYSVGPDGIDDGGQPIDAIADDGCVSDLSKGDIVAGTES